MTESETPTTATVDTTDPEPAAIEEPDRESAAAVIAGEPEYPPAGEPAEAPDPIAAVLERLEDRLEESQRLLARQSDIATSLHAENQRLKAGELLRAQLPLVRDIIRVQDLLGQMLDAAVESTAANDLQMVRDAVLDALARNGIEATEVALGDVFDARRHKVVGVAAIDDAAADRTIAEVKKAGFTWDDATSIRAAEVRVYKHTPAPEAAPAAPEPGATDPTPAAPEDQS